MVKYKVDYQWDVKIRRFEIIRQTPQKFVYMENGVERQGFQSTQDYRWFDTFEEAKGFLVNKFQAKFDYAEKQLAMVKSIELPHA